MIRYTTQPITVIVPRDLTGANVWLSLRQRQKVQSGKYTTDTVLAEVRIDSPTVTVVESDSYVSVELTQDQSAVFKANAEPVMVQVNWVTSQGKRLADRKSVV